MEEQHPAADFIDWPTKQEACDIANVSSRTLERLVKSREIRQGLIRMEGRRPKPVYKLEDLKRIAKRTVPADGVLIKKAKPKPRRTPQIDVLVTQKLFLSNEDIYLSGVSPDGFPQCAQRPLETLPPLYGEITDAPLASGVFVLGVSRPDPVTFPSLRLCSTPPFLCQKEVTSLPRGNATPWRLYFADYRL